MPVLKAIGSFLYQRVWLSKKSTILGLLVYGLGEVIIYFQGPTAPPYARLVAGLVAAPFLAWKDKAVKDGSIALLAILLFASGANAQGSPTARRASAEALAQAIESDPTAVQPGADVPPPAEPQFGGCVGAKKNVCFGPSVSMTVAAINLKTKTVEGAFSPGVGYGFTLNPGKWSSLGADLYFTLDPAAQRASTALLLKLFNGYVRVGASKGLLGDTAWRIPVAFGVPLP